LHNFSKIPLDRVIPEKFVPYLIQKNTALIIQLRSIQSRDEQLTLVAGIEWGEHDFGTDSHERSYKLPAADDADEENLNLDAPNYCKSYV
jgi:hypothetical protein